MKIGKTKEAPEKAPKRQQQKVQRTRAIPVKMPKKVEKKENVPA